MKYLKYYDSYNLKYPNVKIATSNYDNFVSEIEFDKLDIIKKIFPFTDVKGEIDTEEEVNLYFTSDTDFTIIGLWDGKTEKFNSIFKLNDIEIDFNYHPFNSMGGLNEFIFKKVLWEIFDLVNDPNKYEIYKLSKKAKKYNII